VILAVAVMLSGCAIKYPGYETVAVEKTVLKKPCKYIGQQTCKSEGGCTDWLKKRATTMDANTIMQPSNGTTGLMFSCHTGYPLFYDLPGGIWLVTNKFNPAVTKLELEKTIAECTYQTHVATVDTSRNAPARVFIPTNNLNFAINQWGAELADQRDAINHQTHMQNTQVSLFDECLKAKGFVQERGNDEAMYNQREKYCKGINNLAEPCLIPAN